MSHYDPNWNDGPNVAREHELESDIDALREEMSKKAKKIEDLAHRVYQEPNHEHLSSQLLDEAQEYKKMSDKLSELEGDLNDIQFGQEYQEGG